LRNLSLAARSTILVTVAVTLYALLAPTAFFFGGVAGLWAAAAAAAMCLGGAGIALVISYLLRSPARALCGMLLGTAARMAIPLGFGLAAHLRGGPLAEAGLLYYLLVFYPVTLAVETALSLPHGAASVSCPSVSPSVVSEV